MGNLRGNRNLRPITTDNADSRSLNVEFTMKIWLFLALWHKKSMISVTVTVKYVTHDLLLFHGSCSQKRGYLDHRLMRGIDATQTL